MAAADLYRRSLTFLFVAGSLLLTLVILSLLQEWGRNYLVAYYPYDLDARGVLVPRSGAEAPDIVTSTGISLIENVLRIVRVILWMAFVITLVRLVTQLLFRSVLRATAQSEVASLLKTIVSIIVYLVAFFVIFQSQYPEIQLAPLFTGSAILGIVVGLALQDTLGNLFAGIALQADQPFQVGDVISISNRGVGVVEGVSWRGVRIRTFQNKLLVISNAVLGRENIEVAPQNNLNARLVTFNTSYSDSPAKTAQLVRETVRQVENVSSKIRPIVRISDFGERGITWEIKYWPENYAKFNDTDALIRQRIWYAFQREGMTFPYPTRAVYVHKDVPRATDEELATSASEYLESVPIFAPLSEEEIDKLAHASTRRIFAPGEAIVRKGQEGGSMFVIIRGSVKVQLPDGDGARTINQLGANDFFGEMSLLTGQPRSATVIADEETDVMQIRKSALKPLFEANPELMKSICDIVEERKKLLVEKELENTMRETRAEPGIMRTIRNFFGLGD